LFFGCKGTTFSPFIARYFKKKRNFAQIFKNKMMKRLLTTILMVLTFVVSANAVLKEKDLEKTLAILRVELTNTHREMSQRMESNKKKAEDMRKSLMSVLRKSNQNALMIYSQKNDYVFDLTYACHEATEQYQEFKKFQIPFKTYLDKTNLDIARYDSLVTSLKRMPVMLLSDKSKTDRNVCLTLASDIRNTLRDNYDSTHDYIRLYEMSEARLKTINDYANKRYEEIQTSIFKNGGDDYLKILKRLPSAISETQTTVSQKYSTSTHRHSQWDSRIIISLFISIIFYGIIASLLNIAVFRYLLPKRIQNGDFMKKRSCIIMATTTVTFALIVGIIRATTQQNFLIMASDLLVEYAWLLGVILISLLLRLNDRQIKSAYRIYSPLVAIGFVVISFRIILIPSELVNLIFPPILLLCSIWQWIAVRKHNQNIPRSDMFYTYMSLAVFLASVVSSWIGFTLLSVQMLIWWIMQLTCILTIACLSRYITFYGKHHKIDSKPVTSTWAFHFIEDAALPVMGVISVMLSIYWAADVFNLSDLCWSLFTRDFVSLDNLKLSLMRIAVVVSLWFIFRYVSNTTRALLRRHFELQDPTSVESRMTMAKNLLQVVVWGAWFLIGLSILDISFAWLMVVTGGLSTGIGFASKDIIENIYYGISLMAGRIKVGDLIECDGIRGKVASISYTSTLLEATDGSVIAFQNSQLFTKNYKNLTRNHGFALSVIVFGVGYGSDINNACRKVEEAVNNMRHPGLDPEKPVRAVFMEFADSSINIKLLCWVDVLRQVYVESDIKECIYNTLLANDIEMPFPKRDVYIKNE